MLTAYIVYNIPVDFKGFKNNHNITIVCIYLLGPEGIELKFRLRFYFCATFNMQDQFEPELFKASQ